MRENDRMVGVTAQGPDGALEVSADLTIAADGRHSTLRDGAGFEVVEYGAPMDVLWLRLSKRQNDPGQTLGRVDVGRIFIMLDRGDYWQCAFIIPKGGIDDVHARGLGRIPRRDRALGAVSSRTACRNSQRGTM